MAGPGKVEVDVELSINGAPVTGVLVVGPADVLVLNLGPRASAREAEQIEATIRQHAPALVDRTALVSVEGMAVVRPAAPRTVRLHDGPRDVCPTCDDGPTS